MAGKQADIKVGVITNYDDKGLKQAETGLKGFKNSIKDADGVGGKFKAGWGSIKESVSANAGSMAVAAGGALVAFGVKAVEAFTDTAKAALDLSTSTGLSVEEASRWIAVGDDFEVSATALATGLGKVAKTLDDTKWAKYGIETRDASGEARSANDIMIDAFDTLSKVTNETERARIGQELFGKGYQSLTPILGHTREEYEKMLGAVEKGQVITAREAKKAERFRLAQDQLSDALKDVQISIGGVVADLAPMIERTSKTVTQLSELVGMADRATESFGGLGNVLMAAGNPMAALDVATAALTDVVDTSNMSWEEFNKTLAKTKGLTPEDVVLFTQRWYDAHKLLNPALAETEKETRLLSTAMGEVRDREAEATEEARAYAAQVAKTSAAVQADIAEIQAKWDALTGSLDREDAWLNLQQQARDVAQANIDAAEAIKEHGPTSPEAIEAIDKAKLATIDLKRQVIDYGKEIVGLPEKRVTELLAMIDSGSVAGVLTDLDKAFLTHVFRVNAHVDNIIIDGETHAAGSNGNITVNSPVNGGPKAAGGPVQAGVAYTVGEKGPETLVMGDKGGTIIPNGDGGGGVTITGPINIYPKTMPTPDELVSILGKYTARNGPAWKAS